MGERERITHEIGAMGVKLSSRIISLKVDLSLIDKSNDLNVVRCLHVLETSESARGDETSATARLCAPSYFLALGISNQRIGLGRRPETEI